MRLPEPSGGFQWTQAAGRAALACTALPVLHFFTSREWTLALPSAAEAGWTEIAEAAGVNGDRLVRVRQVHGAAALVLHRGGVPHLPVGADGPRVAADIIATDDADVAIAVQTADCVPLLLFDARRGAVAAAHAGWRGLAAGVPRVAVETMARAFGSRLDDLVAAVGPAIGACCYEVGVDVRDALDGRAAWLAPQAPTLRGNPAAPGVEVTGRHGHWFFDSWAATRDQLAEAGLTPDRVHVVALCTASHDDVFCSYRRHGRAAGRMAAVIRAPR